MAPKPRSEQHKTGLYYAREAGFRHSEVWAREFLKNLASGEIDLRPPTFTSWLTSVKMVASPRNQNKPRQLNKLAVPRGRGVWTTLTLAGQSSMTSSN